MTTGEGCYLWDLENRQYLDFTAGIAVNALGHNDPDMVKLISHQVHPPFSLLPVNTTNSLLSPAL
jgi:acetylornithine/succinyldiaminopimelate/putrescine aminotransferase